MFSLLSHVFSVKSWRNEKNCILCLSTTCYSRYKECWRWFFVLLFKQEVDHILLCLPSFLETSMSVDFFVRTERKSTKNCRNILLFLRKSSRECQSKAYVLVEYFSVDWKYISAVIVQILCVWLKRI